MLDPKIIKEKPQIIRDMLKARSVEFDLDELIDSDQKRREFILKTDELRKKKMDFVDGEDGFDFSRYDSGEEDYKEDDDELSMDDVMIGLEKLSPTYKKIFKMFYLDGLSHEEISKKLGISVGTSKSNLFKAKANIKKYLK